MTYPLLPSIIKKGRESSFYLRMRGPLSTEEIVNQKISVSYFDEENETNEQLVMNLSSDTLLPNLNKYAVKLEI